MIHTQFQNKVKPIGLGEIKSAKKYRRVITPKTDLQVEIQDDALQRLEASLKKEARSTEEGRLAVDIYQTAKEIIILAPIAGIKAQDIKLTINQDVISIEGTRSLKDDPADSAYLTKECFWGKFVRHIVLPEEADTSKVTASFQKNILRIAITKKENFVTKVIHIQE